MNYKKFEDLPLCRVRDNEDQEWIKGYLHIVKLNYGRYPHIVVDQDGGINKFTFCELLSEKTKRPMTHAEIFKAISDGAVVCDKLYRNPLASNMWNTSRCVPDWKICYNYTGTDSDVWQPMEVEE